jgi:3'(2'), 5'-bisphosphate nucleotidase
VSSTLTEPADLAGLADLAVAVAREAGELLLQLRAAASASVSAASDSADTDPAALRAAGDRGAHELILAALRAARPDDVVLSEEAADDPARLHARRVWIVDPLDGTREFGEPGRVDWAVHIALWDAEVDEVVIGIVGLPALGIVHDSTRVAPVPPRGAGAVRMAVSRSRPPEVARAAAAELDAELVPLGSAGYKVAAVVSGEVDAYVHAGGQYQWDSAAPIALARAAGLHTSRLDGSPLRYNGPDLSVPDLIVARPELAPAILRVAAAY